MVEFCIRYANKHDISALYNVAEKMNAANETNYFEKCFNEVEDSKRIIVVVESKSNNNILGYGQLIWSPIYAPFRKFSIPEIQDLSVIPEVRNIGIGSAIIDFLEEEAQKRSYLEIGIGVGVISRFGAAQRLYVRKGYIPDGMGVCYDDEPVDLYTMKPIDELLSIKLTKKF